VADVHHYEVHCSWTGSTAVGYENYGRTHDAVAPPSATALRLSADPAFLGDPANLNPESLVLMAAASCQLLSFLAVAARARCDVIEYHDTAEAFMPEDDRPIRITRIVLRPQVTVRAPATAHRVHYLCQVAHRECFVANSLRSVIVVEPQVTILPGMEDGA